MADKWKILLQGGPLHGLVANRQSLGKDVRVTGPDSSGYGGVEYIYKYTSFAEDKLAAKARFARIDTVPESYR